jgi:cellulose biosynthesis protein BcsQ
MNIAIAAVQCLLLILVFGFLCIYLPANSIWQIIISGVTGLAGGLLFNKDLFDLFEAFLRRTLQKFKRPTQFIFPKYSNLEPQEISQGLLANLPHRGAELWVVLSSKGGVGKSMLSLGLTELLSKEGNVLLVDFDIQNKGLTSLLNKTFEYDGSVFSLATEFEKYLKDSKNSNDRIGLVLESRKFPPDGFTVNDFNAIVAGFSVERAAGPDVPTEYRTPRIIQFDKLENSNSFSIFGPKSANSNNAYFLRSRTASKPGEEYLFSDIPTRGLPFVTYFLKSLCALAGNNPIQKIVLDCHGAHDMLTAGAILAADRTVIVSTTDPGCYEGTLEIVETVNNIEKQRNGKPSAIYVVNRVGKLDTRAQEIRELISGITGRQDIVEIPEISEVREIPKNYSFGTILDNQPLASRLEIIKYFLINGEFPELGSGLYRLLAGYSLESARNNRDPEVPASAK